MSNGSCHWIRAARQNPTIIIGVEVGKEVAALSMEYMRWRVQMQTRAVVSTTLLRIVLRA